MSTTIVGGVTIKDTATKSIDEMIRTLSGEYKVEITPALNVGTAPRRRDKSPGNRPGKGPNREATSAEKLEHLAEQGRDFLQVTPAMELRVIDFLHKALFRLMSRNLPIDGAFKAVGEAVRQHLVWRFRRSRAGGPPDSPMPGLSHGWIRHKRHDHIGVYTGRLMLSLVDAEVKTTRVK